MAEDFGGLTKVSANTLKKLMLKQKCEFKQKKGETNIEKNIIQAKERETNADVRIFYSKS